MLLNCPHCDGQVEAELTSEPQLVSCPHCAQEIQLPPSTPEPQDDLDGSRIRQISAIKRSAYRTRSYFLIGAVLCLAGFGQTAWNALASLHSRAGGLSYLFAALWALASLACAAGVWWMLSRADHYRQEAARSSLRDPDQPPDFAPLSDGSQAWKNLEQIGSNPDSDINDRK